jgi:hypothetical protein
MLACKQPPSCRPLIRALAGHVERDAMGDVKSKKVIVVKGMFFLGIIVGSAALLFLDRPSVQSAVLLVVLVWASARFYYYLFYVLEKYVDPSLQYSGLIALMTALARRRRDRT